MSGIHEQWKLDGNCNECRRQPYCKKECSAFKKRMKEITEKAIREYMSRYYFSDNKRKENQESREQK